ncbi:MAG: sulfite exporter TauE/SafE family protein, partial [Turneriella sp.]|nr:sulfite exporter TauE/SafE family protein [Turneriella sp.]
YALLGVSAGALSMLFTIKIVQLSLAQLAGILAILAGIWQLLPLFPLRWSNRLYSKLGTYFSPLLPQGMARFFFLGMLNGILPCGMVASALVVSLASQSWQHGFFYMLLFGVGTFPLMLLASVFGFYLSARSRSVLSWLGPAYALLVGILLLLRPAAVLPDCTH